MASDIQAGTQPAFVALLDKAAFELKLQHQRELDENAAVLSLQHDQETAILAEELRELRAQLGIRSLEHVSRQMFSGKAGIETSTDASLDPCKCRQKPFDTETPLVPLPIFEEVVLHAALDDEQDKVIATDAILEDLEDSLHDECFMPPSPKKTVIKPEPPSPTESCPSLTLEPSERHKRNLNNSGSVLDIPTSPNQERRPSYFDLTNAPGTSSWSTDSPSASASWNLEGPLGPRVPIRSVLKRRTLEYSTSGSQSQSLTLGRSLHKRKTYDGGSRANSIQHRPSLLSVNIDDRRLHTDHRVSLSGVPRGGMQPNGLQEIPANRHNHRMSLDVAFATGELHPEIMSLVGADVADRRMSTNVNPMDMKSPGNVGRRVTWIGEEGQLEDEIELPPTETVIEEEEEQVEMLPVWKFRRKSSMGGRKTTGDSRNSFKQVVPLSKEGFQSSSSDSADEHHCCAKLVTRCVSKPSSSKRLLWDVFGVLLIGFDLIWIPMQAFDPEKTDAMSMIAWTSTIFWTLDIPASFLVGYHNEGVLEMRLPYIASHYCRTWLPFDIVIVVIDWALTVMELLTENAVKSEAGGVGYMRLGKAVRFLRLLRLLRLLKASGVLKEMLERIQSEAVLILVGIGKLLLLILMMNHLIACAWYGLGKALDMNTWVKATDIESRNVLYQYSTSLHWSLTQFTPASMEVFPENEVERLFAVTVILTAMVAFSSFVSAITNAMTQLRNLNSERNTQYAQLRKYFAENKVSVQIMGRIYCCLQQVMSKSKSRVHEVDVTILQLLPWSLKSELLEEVYAPMLSEHPFFLNLRHCHPVLIRKLFQSAIEEMSKPIGQELFIVGEVATKMYFVLSGYLSYTREKDENEKAELHHPVFLEASQWCSEPVLWIRWKHVGQLLATSHCELVTLNATKVGEVLSQLKEEEDQVKRYVKIFVRYFKKYPDSLHDAWADLELIEDMTQKAFRGEDLDEEDRPKLRSQNSFFGRRRQSLFNSLNGSSTSLGVRRSQSKDLQSSNSDLVSEDDESEDENSEDSESSTHSAKSKVSTISKKSQGSAKSRKSNKAGDKQDKALSRRSSSSSKAGSSLSQKGSMSVPGEISERSSSKNVLFRSDSNISIAADKGENGGVSNDTPASSKDCKSDKSEKQPRWVTRSMSETSNADDHEIDQWLQDLPTWRSMRSETKKEGELADAQKGKIARFFGWGKANASNCDFEERKSAPAQKVNSGSSLFKAFAAKRASTVSFHT